MESASSDRIHRIFAAKEQNSSHVFRVGGISSWSHLCRYLESKETQVDSTWSKSGTRCTPCAWIPTEIYTIYRSTSNSTLRLFRENVSLRRSYRWPRIYTVKFTVLTLRYLSFTAILQYTVNPLSTMFASTISS